MRPKECCRRTLRGDAGVAKILNTVTMRSSVIEPFKQVTLVTTSGEGKRCLGVEPHFKVKHPFGKYPHLCSVKIARQQYSCHHVEWDHNENTHKDTHKHTHKRQMKLSVGDLNKSIVSKMSSRRTKQACKQLLHVRLTSAPWGVLSVCLSVYVNAWTRS